jgi:hypothetical protein
MQENVNMTKLTQQKSLVTKRNYSNHIVKFIPGTLTVYTMVL